MTSARPCQIIKLKLELEEFICPVKVRMKTYHHENALIDGGNIYFDGSIIYTSTLNIAKNLEYWEKKHPAGLLKKKIPFQGNPRIITDDELIEIIDATLFSWIEMEKNQ